MDVVHFRLDGRDDRLALHQRLHLLVDLGRLLREIRDLDLDRGNLLLRERQLRAALLERLVHRFGALDLIFGRVGLRHRIPLARLHA